jgi:flagellar P-ring protein FlgI
MKRTALILTMAVGIMLPSISAAPPVRIKDITEVAGEHTNKLTGFGLVSGLNGTGGSGPITKQIALQMLQKLGVRADPRLVANIQRSQEKTDNISIVTVTAELPPHSKPQQRIDVLVSALDDATSLQGGTLIQTLLTGVDGTVYAIADGAISVDGGSFGGLASTVTKNHPTTGRIPGGAIIEVEVPTTIFREQGFAFLLRDSDYETATRVADEINSVAFGSAIVLDPTTIAVQLPADALAQPYGFVAMCQNLEVEPDVVARVVINERTGTVVVGENVRLSSVAITHGNIIVSTVETPQVSQPLPFSDGETVVVPNTTVDVAEQDAVLNLIDQTATVGDIATSLNALGVTPRDLSAIFQMLKESGALHAELQFK